MTSASPSVPLSRVPPSATGDIRDRIKGLVEAGQEIFRLDSGEIAYDTPAIDAAFTADLRHMHPYGPPLGRSDLRASVVNIRGQELPAGFGPEAVLVTNGAKQAVSLAVSVLGGPGCDVLVPAPYWVSYPPIVTLAGGNPVIVPTTAAEGFKVTPAMLESAWSPRSTCLLLNSPGNPTGVVYTQDELRSIAEWANARRIWVISDEIYREITSDGGPTAPSIATCGVEGRYVIVDGISKAYALAGWRVGWLIAPPEVLKCAKSVMAHTTSHTANFNQLVAELAVRDRDFVSRVRTELDARRNILVDALEAVGLPCVAPTGSIYAFPSIEPLMGRHLGGVEIVDDLTGGEALLNAAGVASVPGQAFGVPNHLRLGIGRPQEDLRGAARRLKEVLS